MFVCGVSGTRAVLFSLSTQSPIQRHTTQSQKLYIYVIYIYVYTYVFFALHTVAVWAQAESANSLLAEAANNSTKGNMAPKKEKTKASNKTAAGAAASSSAGNPSAAGIVPLAVPQRVHNSLDAHLVKVHNALNTINNHPLFSDISAKSPLSIQDGGGEHPYFFAESRVVLTQKSSYCAAGNFMWLAHTWMCNHRVPVNPGQIKHLMKNKFPYNAPPERSPYRVQVALDWCDHDACTSAGSLQRFSPEEIDHACLFSIAEAIEKKCQTLFSALGFNLSSHTQWNSTS